MRPEMLKSFGRLKDAVRYLSPVWKGGVSMSVVKVGENESLESALKRFKRKCQKDNILGDLRKKEFYEKPSVQRKKKSEAARKRGNKG